MCLSKSKCIETNTTRGVVINLIRLFLFILGIGKETAKNMAEREARVIMACRNVESAERVKGKIIIKQSVRRVEIVSGVYIKKENV